MEILFNLFPEGKTKALTMSYDDGSVFDRRLVDLLNRHGIRGTFHLNSALLDQGNHITGAEVAALYAGHEVAVHTATHPQIADIPLEAAAMEIMDDRRRLEALAGIPVRGMSYPYGSYSKEILQMLPGLGIEYSRTTQSTGRFDLPQDFLLWHPTCHHRDMLELGRTFLEKSGAKRFLLFYVWGHSHEFDRQQNWELAEEFCALMEGREDIWYATNMEILRYIQAVRGLRFTADCGTVYNPSCLPVWIQAEGRPVRILGGETVRLAGK